MNERDEVLTVEEVAAFLRVKPVEVQQLLESGRLAGLNVAGHCRILTAAVVDFLGREMEASQQEALSRQLADPRTWARELQRIPELCASLEGQEFGEGTMGAFLKGALRELRALEAEKMAENVIPFKPKTD